MLYKDVWIINQTGKRDFERAQSYKTFKRLFRRQLQ